MCAKKKILTAGFTYKIDQLAAIPTLAVVRGLVEKYYVAGAGDD